LTAVAEANLAEVHAAHAVADRKEKAVTAGLTARGGRKEPIASSLFLRTLPKSLTWPNCTSSMSGAAWKYLFDACKNECDSEPRIT